MMTRKDAEFFVATLRDLIRAEIAEATRPECIRAPLERERRATEERLIDLVMRFPPLESR